MQYRLTTGRDAVPIETDTPENGNVTLTIGETTHTVRFGRVSDHLIHMQVRTGDLRRQIKVFVAGSGPEKTIVINGRTWQVKDLDQEGQNGRRGMALKGPDQITPPMPAVVIKVSVAVGDRVEKGQEVVVLSAMKMETTLRAPFNGTVTAINAAVSDKVTPGQILVDIKEEKEAPSNE